MFKRILIPVEEYEKLINENHQLKSDLRFVRLNLLALFNIANNSIEGNEWVEQLNEETEKNRTEWELWN